MHTIKDVRLTDFTFYVNDKEVSMDGVFPGFNKQDRIGIVTHSEGGTLGASVLLMASVTAFYNKFKQNELGNECDKLRIYPEYFVFHVGKSTGNSAELDIWPPHREVIVENDAEQILEAINDRGITRLLIEEKPESRTILLRETISSAESRIKSVFMFSREGQIQGGNIKVVNNGSFTKFALKSYEDSATELGVERAKLIAYPKNELLNGAKIVQSYKLITLDTAFRSLTDQKQLSETTSHYINSSADGTVKHL